MPANPLRMDRTPAELPPGYALYCTLIEPAAPPPPSDLRDCLPMGRYRPPRQRGSRYITADGARRLRAELDELWRQRRPEVVAALSAAAAEGDRSENAEYIYRKKQLGEIDRRVRYLSRRLDELSVVDQVPADTDRVFFGAWVTVEDEEGREACHRIVGPDEIDPARGWISMDSPVARALLRRTVGDSVEVSLPNGATELHIVDVRYVPDADQTGASP